MDPLQAHHLVKDPEILSVRVLLPARQMRQVDKAHSSHAVSDCHQDDFSVIPHKIGAVVQGIDRTPLGKPAAMDPYHDRLFLRGIRRVFPDVEVQAVLSGHGEGSRVVGRFRLEAFLNLFLPVGCSPTKGMPL